MAFLISGPLKNTRMVPIHTAAILHKVQLRLGQADTFLHRAATYDKCAAYGGQLKESK